MTAASTPALPVEDEDLPTVPSSQVRLRVEPRPGPDFAESSEALKDALSEGPDTTPPRLGPSPSAAETQRQQVLSALGLELQGLADENAAEDSDGAQSAANPDAGAIHSRHFPSFSANSAAAPHLGTQAPASTSLLHESVAPHGVAPALIAVLAWTLAAGVVVGVTIAAVSLSPFLAAGLAFAGTLGVALLLVLGHLIRVQEQQRWLLARLVDRLENQLASRSSAHSSDPDFDA